MIEHPRDAYKRLMRHPPRIRGAQRTQVDGIWFASGREANRYKELKLLQKAGQIKDLTLQKGFSFEINGVHLCDYYADFTYYDKGKFVVEDCKGYRTDIYNIKKKLMKIIYRIEILET